MLAVGDAAGLVKPTTGGGIYYGLISGRLAANALDAALCAERLRAFDQSYRTLKGFLSSTGILPQELALDA